MIGDVLRPDPRAPGLVVGQAVTIDETAVLGANVVLHSGTIVGPGATVHHNAVVGRPSLRAGAEPARREEPPPTVLEAGSLVGCGSVLSVGARLAPGAIVGDHALLREGASLGPDAVVGHACGIGTRVEIGARSRFQNQAMVAWGTIVEEDVFVGPNLAIANDVTMGRHERGEPLAGARLRRACRIGASVTLMPGVEIGEEAVVGAGALVRQDVPPRMVAVGVPARSVRAVREDERLERWR